MAVDYAALSAYARGHHPPHASSSKLPSRSPDSSSGLTLVTAKAELVPPQPAATTATAALRKGKGRQLCMPCIEIDEKHVANPKRAASSGPTVQLLHSGEAALSEKPDGHKSSDIRRASSARPSNRISTTFQNIHERKAVFRYASDAQLVAPHPRRQQQDLKQLRIGYVPESITPSSSLDDFLASSVSGTMTSACSENPEATARPPAAHVSVAKAVTAHPQEGHDTHGDVAGEKAGAILISALASSVEKPTTSGAIYAPAANMHVLENQIAAEGDLVSTIFPENEQPADARLGRNSGQEEAPSSPPLQLQEVISISDGQQASQASAGNAKKSVSFAVGDDIESARSQQRRSTSKRARLKAIRRKQVSQEFFVGEAEDYRPSDLEDQSDDSDAISGPSKTSTTVPSSSPLTPLSSGNARPSSISSDNANLVGFLRSFSRSSGSGSGNKAGKPGGRIIARRIVDSDYSDDDGEVPLRRLKTRRPSPHKKEFQQSQPDGALVRPVRSCKSTSNSLTSATSLVEKRPTSRTLVTRSRSTGDNADCLQCHRCELYQPQSKTLRCMTCEKAVCSICLVAHYAGHPSYAATLAYLRIDPASNLPDESVDVSQIDFRCPVCKYICRCMTCLRGPIPVQKSTAPAEPFPAELASPERSESMRRTDSLLSSDADPEPLHWPSLVRGTSTRPNLKVRPRVGRTAAASSRLSKSAQHNMRLSAANNAYYDLQEAIAGEAARRAQVDAETDFVPVVSSRVPRNSLPSSPQRGLSSTSQTNSSDSNESDMVQVATSKRPRPTLSARVRLATKVGQQLGKSPAYVESRRSPRREGDQLM